MSKVHASQIKAAAKKGIDLSWDERYNLACAFWPQRNLRVYSPSVAEAKNQINAAQTLLRNWESDGVKAHFHLDGTNPTKFYICMGENISVESKTPLMWAVNKNYEDAAYVPYEEPLEPKVIEGIKEDEAEATDDFQEDAAPTISGVPTNGGAAHAKGYALADCPFQEDEAGWEPWHTAFEAAAIETPEPAAKVPTNSVVSERYRKAYAELGHPTHCGDELARKLNDLCIVDGATDMERFEAIMEANGVNTTKYNRTIRGWQGRLRMTGRNILARVVRENGGVLGMPEHLNGGTPMHMSREWLALKPNKKAE